jgi:3-hydroxyethyl bacteriochlorophyllide a dehydrogenase
MRTLAITFEQPLQLGLRELELAEPQADDVVIGVEWSGISTGTERLLWTGRMPAFPGLGYPLVPGYEAVGRVIRGSASSPLIEGDRVFVPGARCFPQAFCLFGASARHLMVRHDRALKVDESLGASAALLALAATAYHALRTAPGSLPDLIVGHGALGRLLARLAIALDPSRPAPLVWEHHPARTGGARGYNVVAPESATDRPIRSIYDVSGDPDLIDTLVDCLRPGGELVLAGFYAVERLSFAFTPAFMRGLRLRVAAEWEPADLRAVQAMANAGTLDLSGIITHHRPALDAAEAYSAAFSDPACVKMILDWRNVS